MCNFPAKRLLQTRRDIAKMMENLDAAHALRIINAIDEAGNHHEDKAGCQCWYKAGDSFPPLYEKQQLTHNEPKAKRRPSPNVDVGIQLIFDMRPCSGQTSASAVSELKPITEGIQE